jgi:hypothetical protein
MTDEKEVNIDNEDMFRFKLGKWVLLRDECVFTSLQGFGKDVPILKYLLELIDNWVNKKEELAIQEFVSEMCKLIKSENEDLYFHLTEKCALNGISVGEGIFEALSVCRCEEANNLQCRKETDESSINKLT